MSSSLVFVASSNVNAGSLSSARSLKRMRRARTSGGDSRSHPYSARRLTAGIVPAALRSAPCLPGIDNTERFHMPSRFWVTASLMAGRCEYGSQSIPETGASAGRATSTSARYLIGAAACSSSQLNGKVSCSGAGVGIVVASSAVLLGTVKSGTRRRKPASLRSRRAHEPAASAGKNSRFSVGR
jgi:hypothetical protein